MQYHRSSTAYTSSTRIAARCRAFSSSVLSALRFRCRLLLNLSNRLFSPSRGTGARRSTHRHRTLSFDQPSIKDKDAGRIFVRPLPFKPHTTRSTPMCLVSTPIHACSHTGAHVVYGEPCARANVSETPRFDLGVTPWTTATSPAVPRFFDLSVSPPTTWSRKSRVSSATSDSSSDSTGSYYKSCNFIEDYGTHNVKTYCPKCITRGSKTTNMAMQDMLGAIKAARSRDGAGRVVEPLIPLPSTYGSSLELDSGVPVSELGDLGSLDADTGVPEPGNLGSMGADRVGKHAEADIPDLGDLSSLGAERVGQEVVANFNMHWRTYSRRY